ncbi:MAG: ERAD-associated protein [Chrysothrix sp. TS-e1954]|nr:MAG: ERAD-associated protein [Chrysothrix sp. TS-e1954]
MTTRLQQLWLLLLLLFLTHCGPGWTASFEPEASSIATEEASSIVASEGIAAESSPAPLPLPGQEDVKAAQALLKKLPPSSRRWSRYNRPSGFFSTLTYYFKWLFTLLFLNTPSSTSNSTPRKLSVPLTTAVDHLQRAATLSNPDALYILADLNFYGGANHPRNYTTAFEYYNSLASLNGNATAQYHVAFMYATGIGAGVPRDQAKALLYHTFAADGGNIKSQMTAGYRHHAGIGSARNCEVSVDFYKEVADKAIEYVRSGPPGGRALVKEGYYYADDKGGVYGEGASVSSSGMNAKHSNPASDAHAAFDDVLEYLDLMSRKGETKATFGLARLHYDGSRTMRQDYKLAKEFFLDITRRYWTKDGRVRSDTEPGLEVLAAKAAGYLGRMFLRGEGVDQDFSKARIWFKRGIDNGDALSQYSMGIMHLSGFGMPKRDPVKAAEYFSAAADQDFNSAQVRMGALMVDQGDLTTATRYFDLAARNGHIEALYYLGEMADQGAGRDRSCQQAALYYKLVAEKAEKLQSHFEEANDAYDAGDQETALLLNMMAAEQGYEVAQANVAYLLEQTYRTSPLARIMPYLLISRTAQKMSSITASATESATLALIYWTRSAKQANIDSLLKMGDYYLSGIASTAPQSPTSSPSAQARAGRPHSEPEKSAQCYTAASETHASAQALFNLGWLHEHGVGAARDYHLAKRYYDQASTTNAEAYLPVLVALTRLRFRSWWNGMSGGSVRGIEDDELPTNDAKSARKVKGEYTWTEWFADFLAADQEIYERELAEAAAGGEDGDISLGGIDRLAGEGPGGVLAGERRFRDDEYVPGAEWLGRNSRRSEDDDYDPSDDIDDGILETLIIVALAGALAFLVYWRQVRGLRNRLEEERRRRLEGGAAQVQGPEQAQGEPDRGVFPHPGDPAFADWVAGGIGH